MADFAEPSDRLSRPDFPGMYRERPELFRAQVISAGEIDAGWGAKYQLSVLGFPDTDGRKVYLPVCEMRGDPNSLTGFFAKEGRAEEAGMTADQAARLVEGLAVLKLPLIAAVDVAFNRPEVDLEGYSVNDKPPLLVALSGRAGAGKSMVAAIANQYYDIPVAELDGFSQTTVDEYLELIRSKGSDLTMEQAIAMCRTEWSNLRKPVRPKWQSARAQLAWLTDGLLRREYGQGLVLVSMAGVHSDSTRPVDAFDVVREGMVNWIVINPAFGGAEEIGQNIEHWLDSVDGLRVGIDEPMREGFLENAMAIVRG